jgi:hypothetical protein
MSDKTQDKDFNEKFDRLDGEMYRIFVEMGWIIPRTEEEVMLAEKRLKEAEIPPFPEELKDPSGLIAQLRKEIEPRGVFKGIIAAAKDLGINNFQLAEMTGLSIVLVAQFDRGLIKVNENLPLEVVRRIAGAINETTQRIFDHLMGGPRFAQSAEFKADDSPVLPEAQDFAEAVIDDPTLSDERRRDLLALSNKA